MSIPEETETVDERRERRFRRLLRAYPAWYRQERGEEMLTTLMDAAQGRDRPTLSQRVDVRFGGLRKHLAAGSIPAAVTGVLVALFVATLGAIAGALGGWQAAADLPDDATADGIAQQAIPDMDTKTSGDRSLFYWGDMRGKPMDTPFAGSDGDDHNAGRLIYELEHPIDGYARFHEAKERMAAAGWEVQSVSTAATSIEFAATRDGLDLNVSTSQDSSSPSRSSIYVYRATPTLVPVLTVAGLIVGGLVGWTVNSRLHRHATGKTFARFAAIPGLLGIGGFVLAVPTAINLYFAAASLIMPEERVPVWLGFTVAPFSSMTMLGIAALGAALLCAVVTMSRQWFRLSTVASAASPY